MKPRYPHQPIHNPIVGLRGKDARIFSEGISPGALNSVNIACSRWLEKRGLHSDTQLMRANYKAGVVRRPRREAEEGDEIV